MNQLTPQMLAQIFAQESDDPFLTLLTLSHPDMVTLYLVNNSIDVLSRGNSFMSFPFTIRLPTDDGESARDVSIEFDNVSLILIEQIRTITTPIQVRLEMVLASMPDLPQVVLAELEIQQITYNAKRVSAKLVLDSFFNTQMTSESYTPALYPAIF